MRDWEDLDSDLSTQPPTLFFSLRSPHLLTAAPLKHTSIQSGPWNQAFQVSFRILRRNGFLPCGRKEDQSDKKRTRRRSEKKKKTHGTKAEARYKTLVEEPVREERDGRNGVDDRENVVKLERTLSRPMVRLQPHENKRCARLAPLLPPQAEDSSSHNQINKFTYNNK